MAALNEKEMMKMNQQQRDIEEERRNGTFQVRQMTYYLMPETDRYEMIRNMVETDPIFSKDDHYFLSVPQRYERGLEKFCHFRELVFQGKLDNLSKQERAIFESISCGFHGMALHQGMFLPTLRGQADEEQQAKWIPLAENYDIIGCYAQTEMGHGSNVRGLETLATFDKEADEFIIHSPTLTSTKWWPGALGKTANHALVHARLILPHPGDGKQEDKGIHCFLAQIRCMKTHETLPGVTTGMLGPRYGTNDNDNGFLRLNHVRIPRRNMLMKYNRVERDGTYHLTNEKAAKLNYGTMLLIRANLVESAGKALSAGVTIATRYSAVRRQFPSSGDAAGEEPESVSSSALEQRVLNYQAQQYRILPLVATAYALNATGFYMKNIFNELQKGLKNGVLDMLPEAHATSSGLKAVTTILASAGIEECRKACGGHGFLLNSGLCELFTRAVSSNTLEGENYLIIQQLSRYLIKSFKSAQAGRPPVGNAKYQILFASNPPTWHPISLHHHDDLLHPQNQIDAYAIRGGHLIAQTVKRLNHQMAQNGQDFGSAFQSIQWLAIRAAKAHCMYTILISFIEFVKNSKNLGPGIYDALHDLCNLFALYHIENELGEFLESGAFANGNSKAEWIHEGVEALLKKVRVNAVGLVDAFNFSDAELTSALGRYDGNVYEALYDWTKLDPMNAKNVPDAYQKSIRPILTKQFSTSKL